MSHQHLDGRILGAALITIGVFLLDVMTGLGPAIWMGYVFALLLVAFSPHHPRVRRVLPFWIALVVAGFLFDIHGLPRGANITLFIFNRSFGLLLFVLLAHFLDRLAQREKIMREREERYRTLFNSIDEGFCIVEVLFDKNGNPDDYRFLEINPSFERQTGLPKALGKRMRELAPTHEKHWFEIYGRIALTGEPMRFQNRAEALGRWYNVYAFRIGQPEERRVAILFNDITEQKKMDGALRESEERFRGTFENAPVGITHIDLNGHWLRVNPMFCKLVGYSREELARMGFWDLTHRDDVEEELELFALLIHGKIDRFEREKRYVHKDGHLVWVHLSRSLQRNAANQPLYIITNVVDITKRKEAEEALRRARDEWESTFDAVPDLIAILDSDQRVVRVNRAMSRRLKVEPEACVGLPCFKALHCAEEPPASCPHRQTIADHLEHSAELHEECLEGDFLVTTTPIKDGNGEMIGTVHVARDITERKRYERDLQNTAKDLANSNKDLEHFAYVASHDLQEPLRTVSSFAQLLKKRYKDRLDENANEYIQFMTEGATRMQSLILDLLAFSRVGSQGKPLAPVQSEAALDEALRALKEAISDNGAIVTRDPLPMVRGDSTQVTQLFQNLIGNAIKFHREGVRPEVHISAKEDGNFQVFRVADNGIGIDPKYNEKIFTIFQRLHTTDKYKGTGLGLAICKRIVERHGGRIWVESEPGQGTTFFFSLPKA